MGDSYSEALSSRAPRERYELLSARWDRGRRTGDYIAKWIDAYSQLQMRHASELETFLAKHVLPESKLGTLAEPWQRTATMVVEQSRLSHDSAKRAQIEGTRAISRLSDRPEVTEVLQRVQTGNTVSIDEFQRLDAARLTGLKASLTAFASIEADRAQGITRAADSAMQAWLGYEANDGIQAFVAEVISGVVGADESTVYGSGAYGRGGAYGSSVNLRGPSNSTTATEASSRQPSQATVNRKSSFLGRKDKDDSGKQEKGGIRSRVNSIFGRKKRTGSPVKGELANRFDESSTSLSGPSSTSLTGPPMPGSLNAGNSGSGSGNGNGSGGLASTQRPDFGLRQPSQLSTHSNLNSPASSLRQQRQRDAYDDLYAPSSSPRRLNAQSTGSQQPGMAPGMGPGMEPPMNGQSNFTPLTPTKMKPRGGSITQHDSFTRETSPFRQSYQNGQPMAGAGGSNSHGSNSYGTNSYGNNNNNNYGSGNLGSQAPLTQQSTGQAQPLAQQSTGQFFSGSTTALGGMGGSTANLGGSLSGGSTSNLAPVPPPSRHSVQRTASVTRSPSAASRRNVNFRDSRVPPLDSMPPKMASPRAPSVPASPVGQPGSGNGMPGSLPTGMPGSGQPGGIVDAGNTSGLSEVDDKLGPLGGMNSPPPSVPMAAGSPDTEQFYTPAAVSAPMFEQGNSSVATFSSTLRDASNTSVFPSLPQGDGLVVAGVEHVHAVHEGGKLVESSVRGETVARINPGSSAVGPNVVLGVLLGDPKATLVASPLLHQTSSLSFDVPTHVYGSTTSPAPELLQYTVKGAPSRVPLKLTPEWLVKGNLVQFRIYYELSELFMGESVEIRDLVVTVSYGGTARVLAGQAKPTGTISYERRRMTFRLGETQTLRRGQPAPKLVGQFQTDGGFAQPGRIEFWARVPAVANPVMQLRSLNAQGEWAPVPLAVSGDIRSKVPAQAGGEA